MTGSRTGSLVSINVSNGGVPKLPVLEAHVAERGVAGDRQRDRRFHGGPQRAVCLFSMERIESLLGDGHPIAPGTTGENLTIHGLDWDAVIPALRLRIGEVELEITSYASPCKNIRHSFLDEDFTRMSQKLHPGWSRVYARVLRQGTARIGDAVLML